MATRSTSASTSALAWLVLPVVMMSVMWPVTWPSVARAVIPAGGPLGCAPRHRHRYGQLITEVCRNADQATAEKAWQTLPAWAAWTPGATALITERLTDLQDRVSWRLAVPPLLALLQASRSGAAVRDITSKLAGIDHAVGGLDQPGRDRPARQRLTHLVQQVESWGRRPDLNSALDLTPLADAGRDLAGIPDFTRQAAALLVAAVPVHRGTGQRLASRLAEVCDLLGQQDAAAARAASALGVRVADNARADLDTLYAAAVSLQEDHRLSAGLFAVALARQGVKRGWPADWQALIRELRAHPVPDVRAAALDIVMVPE
jgi:hypothetical protein